MRPSTAWSMCRARRRCWRVRRRSSGTRRRNSRLNRRWTASARSSPSVSIGMTIESGPPASAPERRTRLR
ncbi:MAG: hypothetical protein ACT6RN_02745 [Agrobacterium sp.]|uniref:hypothetical protein n=1 Tax=Agrobacterium sp. TaxID=361 RepID=UPI004037C7B3